MERRKLGIVVVLIAGVTVGLSVTLFAVLVGKAEPAGAQDRRSDGSQARAELKPGPGLLQTFRVTLTYPGASADRVLEEREVIEINDFEVEWDDYDRLWVYTSEEELYFFEEQGEGDWARKDWYSVFRWRDDDAVASFCGVGREGADVLPSPPKDVMPGGYLRRFESEANERGWHCRRSAP